MCKRKSSNNISVKTTEKIIMVIVFLCFISTLIFSLISFYKSKQNQISVIEKSLQEDAKICKEFIEEYFEYNFRILNYLASNKEIYNMERDDQYSFLSGKENLLDFEHFIIMDMQGNGYYCNSNEVKDQSYEEFFHDVIDNERFITEPFMDVYQNRSITTLSVSIYKDKNKVGALCGVIDLNKIYNIFKNKIVGNNGYSFLINNNGDYVAHKNMQFVHESKNIFDDSEGTSNNIDFLIEGINKGEPSLGKVILNGQEYYASFSPLDSVKWNAVFLVPTSKALSGLNKLVIFQSLALVSGLLLIVFGMRIVYKNVENHRLAYTDGLTNINNRAAVSVKLKELDDKYKHNITIIAFDLNNFKYVNDNFGHDIGDKLLIKFASILQETFGSIGFVARMGGDEFIAILNNIDIKVVKSKIDDIKEKIENYNCDKICKLEISYGYFNRDNGDKTSLSEIYKEADKKMYMFKRKTKNI